MGKNELIANGKTEYVIVCGKEALPAEANAAAELQKYLEKIISLTMLQQHITMFAKQLVLKVKLK